MKFTDYPKDLQRIVELTPEGWNCGSSLVQMIPETEVSWLRTIAKSELPYPEHCFDRVDYEQCRAQWLAEKSEADWRGLCEELTAVIDGFIEMWDGPKYAMHMIENVQAARPVADKARKALEKTK